MNWYWKSIVLFLLFGLFPLSGESAVEKQRESLPVVISMTDLWYSLDPSPTDPSSRWRPISQFDPSSLQLDKDPQQNFFWVRIRLPEPEFKYPALFVSAFLEGFEIWLGGIQCYHYSPSSQPEFRYNANHIIPLPAISTDHDFMMKIHYSARTGMGEIFMLALGSAMDLIKISMEETEVLVKSSIKDLLLGFLLMVMGIISVFIFLIRLQNRDYPFFSFGFFAFCAGAKYLAALKYLHFINISPAGLYYLESLFFLLTPAGLFMFTDHIFGGFSYGVLGGKTIRWLWLGHLALAGISPLLIRINMMYDQLMIILFLASSLICCYYILKHRKEFDTKISRPFAIFFFMLIILLINELLKLYRKPFLPIDLFGWVLLALVLALVYILIEQYTKIYFRMQQFSLDLEKKRYELLKLEQANLLTQFEALKNQLNPHFLFNNFSTLVAIIEEDPSLAVSYVQELTRVYRYILKTRIKDLVRTKDEIAFVNSYIFLLSKRFENNLQVSVVIPDSYMEDLTLPFCLQLLVENAIKHNIISSKMPLSIRIGVDGDYLVVNNNYQPKNVQEESTGIGLSNLIKRYRFFTEKKVEILSSGSHFTVKLPFL